MVRNYTKAAELGMTLLEVIVMILLLCVILLMLISVPIGYQKRAAAPEMLTKACLYQLKNIGELSLGFAEEHGGHFPPSINPDSLLESNSAFSIFDKLAKFDRDRSWAFNCPSDKSDITQTPSINGKRISYFFSIDARPDLSSCILSGDCDIRSNGSDVKPGFFPLSTNESISWSGRFHQRSSGAPCGNLLFVDGHAETVYHSFNSLIATQGIGTNRLAVP